MDSKKSLPSLIVAIVSFFGLIVVLFSAANYYQIYGWKSWYFLGNVLGLVFTYIVLMTGFSVLTTSAFSEIAPHLVTPDDLAYDENLVRSNRKRNSSFFDKISNYVSDNPPIIYFILTILLVIVFFRIDNIYFDPKYKYYDLLVEAHGLIYDALIFGLLLSFYEKFRIKNEHINRNLERIEDFAGVQSLEAKQKIIMSLLRLSRYRIRQIYLRKVYLKKAELDKVYLSESIIFNSNFENAELQNSNFDNCFLFDSNFSKVTSNNSNFREAIIVNVNLNESILEKVNLTNSMLIDCAIKFKNVTDAVLDNVVIDDKSIFETLLNFNCIGAVGILEQYEIVKYDKYFLAQRFEEATKWLKDENIKGNIKERFDGIISSEDTEFYIIKKKR